MSQEEDEQPQLDMAGLCLSDDPYDNNFGKLLLLDTCNQEINQPIE